MCIIIILVLFMITFQEKDFSAQFTELDMIAYEITLKFKLRSASIKK